MGGIIWEGSGLNEVGKRKDNNDTVIRIDPRYFRPTEVETLLGDPKAAREKLGWEPQITLEELVIDMIDKDKEEAAKEATLIREGFSVVGSMENPPTNETRMKAVEQELQHLEKKI